MTLDAAIAALLNALDPTELAVVEARFSSRADLEHAMRACADKVIARMARAREPIAETEYGHLAAATLTWGAEHSGVQANPGHAEAKFRYYRCFPRLAPHRLPLLHRGNDPEVGQLLELTDPILDTVAAERPAQPEEMRVIVSTAIVSRLRTTESWTESTAAGLAVAVLDRGVELAAEHRVRRGPLPGAELEIRGNTDLLVLVAAYRRAIDERFDGPPVADALDQIDHAVPELRGRLWKAMKFTPPRVDRDGPDEPDSLLFYSRIAEYLGDRPAVGKVADRLSTRLRRLRLDRDRSWVPTADLDQPGLAPAVPDFASELAADVDHLARWTVLALFDPDGVDAEDAAYKDRETVRRWLFRDRDLDPRDALGLLLSRLRCTMTTIAALPVEEAPEPEGMYQREYAELVAWLSSAINDAVRDGIAKPHETVRLVSAVLPPLWQGRNDVIRLLVGKIQTERGRRGASARAEARLIAATISRGPGQVIHRASAPQHTDRPGCVTEHTVAGGPRCTGRSGRSPDEAVVCPARLWGEVGFVESYTTLTELADLPSAEATRRRLERYDGPHARLLRLASP